MFESADGLLIACTRQNAGMSVTFVDGAISRVPDVTIAADVMVVPSIANPGRAEHSVSRSDVIAPLPDRVVCADRPRVASRTAPKHAARNLMAIVSLQAGDYHPTLGTVAQESHGRQARQAGLAVAERTSFRQEWSSTTRNWRWRAANNPRIVLARRSRPWRIRERTS